MTYPAVVASRPPFVYPREHRRAPNSHDAIIKIFRQRLAHIELDARHLHRRQKFPVWKLRQALRLPADARKLLRVVVPRRDVRVANRPVDCDTFFEVRFKIEVTPAVALASPGDGLATDLTSANPAELRASRIGVRIFLVVHEKFVRVLVTRVVDFALHRLRFLPLGAFVPSAIFQFPGGNVLYVVFLRHDRPARFQHENVQSFSREFFRRPTARNSRSDNQRIIGVRRHYFLRGLRTAQAGTERSAAVLSTRHNRQLQFFFKRNL